jgi:hypothetical protein
MKAVTKTCSRGHIFKKSSDYPVCPICWPGYYKEKKLGEFPAAISAPALRGLLSAKITTLIKLSKYTEKELLELHGVGPASLPILRVALKAKGLSFKK